MRLLHSLIIAALVAGTAAEAADAADAAITVKLIAFNDFHGAINAPVVRTPVDDPQIR